jgi:Cu(I)/Ag(I) efflux system membrane fusion protein
MLLAVCPPVAGQTAEHVHETPVYVCPMHPQIVRDAPGNCPICGMALVQQAVQPEAQGYPVVTLGAATAQNLGVRTAEVVRGTLWKYIKTVGYVAYDENRLAHVHPRASGWVEKLRVRAEGDAVKQGDALLDLYAPEILGAQVDFLTALRQQAALPKERLHSIRNRLRLLDVPEGVIGQIEKKAQTQNTVPMLAPQDGVVTRLSIREGMYVTPEMELFTIADLSNIWVLVEVYEAQLDWVKPGLSAEIEVPALPGRKWEGEVDYLYPELTPTTRTLKVRLKFPNPARNLKPNMFADVVIYGGPLRDAVKIPREALIETGARESVVLALDEGRFQPVDVKTGMRGQGQVEILEGLQEGQRVVVSGQFLIDSESNLQASFRRMAR